MSYEYSIDVGGVVYGMDIQSAIITHPLFDTFSVGNVCSAQLDMSFWPEAEPPRMASIKPSIREVGTEQWHPLGEFFIDTRSKEGGRMDITAYDAALKGEVEWIPDDEMEFPMPMDEAVSIIAGLIGIAVDKKNAIRHDYTIDYPANGYTLREVLGYIAAANGGNFFITQQNELRFVPLFGYEEEQSWSIGKRASSFQRTGDIQVDGIALVVDDDNEYRSGDMDGYVLEVQCPYGSQEMADALLESIGGHVYRGYEAQGAELDPTAELGDGVEIDGVECVIASRTVRFGPGHFSGLTAPGEYAVDHEYPYVSQTKRESKRSLATARSLISKNSEEIRLEISGVKEQIDGVQSELSSQFSVLENEIRGELRQVVEDQQASDADLQGKYNEIVKYIRFTMDGLEIGESTSPLILRLNNDRMSFIENGQEVAYISDRNLYVTDAHFLNSLRLGSFAFVPRQNGNLSLVKVE